MSFFGSLLGIIGFVTGIPFGLFLGFLVFIQTEPTDSFLNLHLQNPFIRTLQEFDTDSWIDILPELPLWVKQPDYERVDWLNGVIRDMWPYLDKAICGMIRSMSKPIFSDYIGMFPIRSIDFESLTLGTLPPIFQGMKVHILNADNLIFEFVAKWAGNPNITLVLNILFLPIKVQLIDIQTTAALRVTLKPFVPTIPCFSNVTVSIMDKPEVDFGLKVMGGDLMAIPGLYHFIQKLIKKQVASLYLWPQALEIPILDASIGAAKKPVGILRVKVVRANKLLKMDLIGTSDPYVQLRLSGEKLPSKKTSIKTKNLNPEWNEEFRLTVKDPQSQVLELHVYDWEKVGLHDKLGMQVIPLKLLAPQETKEFTVDLVRNLDPNDECNKKPRGSITVELTFVPFMEDPINFNGPIDLYMRRESVPKTFQNSLMNRAGLLLVTVIGAEDVEGKHHNNPYALVVFKGEKRKTKILKKTRDPKWNEEFQFMLDEAPLEETVHIEIISKRKHRAFGFGLTKERLGHVDIQLVDVVYNNCINEKYHLINSRNGVIHVDIKWNVT
ncbi:synaptotagmin-3-like isoform X1 [Cynara cardunculus var. scolymus]|uniref:synaptotagmin-3-like isoform X1 n=1 Tax=Cynara cardunculus var. scolymus TaxID=59895 RepID=UPI000D62C816|nr:synaptotagmin-3-like isoform X1 [Cynara cardunculus var. scolymus]